MNNAGGIEFTVKGNFNEAATRARLKAAVKRAQMKLDTQVLADSNYFVPKDSTMLEKSGIINTAMGGGLVSWKADYARRQYYGDSFDHSKQRNSSACARWFEAAKARWLEKWRKLVNDEIKHS